MHVISVSSLKGGVGKTTMTLGIASAAFSRGIKTLIVDMDPQCDATTGLGVDMNSPTSIADVLNKPKAHLLGKAIVPSSWAENHPHVIDVIPGSPDSVKYDEPRPKSKSIWTLDQALATVEDYYDFVVIDCPPSLNALTQTAWAASDQVLIVSEPALFSAAATARALRAIQDASADRKRGELGTAGIVINRFRPRSIEHQFRVTEMSDMFGDVLLPFRFEERTSVQQAQGAAKPIHSWPGEHAQEVAHQFDQLLDVILRKGY